MSYACTQQVLVAEQNSYAKGYPIVAKSAEKYQQEGDCGNCMGVLVGCPLCGMNISELSYIHVVQISYSHKCPCIYGL